MLLRDCLRCNSAAVGGGGERSHDCYCEEANAAYWWQLAAGCYGGGLAGGVGAAAEP